MRIVIVGAGAVVHLAWQIQPSHEQRASSVGTYAPGPKDRPVSERWPAARTPGHGNPY